MLKHILLLSLLCCFLVGCAYKNHITRGNELSGQGQYTEALGEYESALALDPDSEEAQRLVTATRRTIALQVVDGARRDLAAGHLLAALEQASTALQHAPGHPRVMQLCTDVSTAHQIESAAHLQQREYAIALGLLRRVHDRIPGERGKLAAPLAKVARLWADTLVAAGTQAEGSGLLGDALLLYAQAFTLVRSPVYRHKRDALRIALLDRESYVVGLQGEGFPVSQILLELGVNSPGIKLVAGPAESHAKAVLMVDRPRFTTTESRAVHSAQYQSGTRQVTNPRYASQERDVLAQEERVLDVEENVFEYERELIAYEEEVAREGDTPGTTTGAEQNVTNTQSRLNSERDRLIREKRTLIRERNDLANTESTRQEPTYSSIRYTVTTVTRASAAGFKMWIDHGDGRPKMESTTVLRASATDSTHDAQPIAGIVADRLHLPSDTEIANDLFQQAYARSSGLLRESLRGHRTQLLRRARAQSEVSQRIHLYVLYILLDPSSVDVSVVDELRELRNIPDSIALLQMGS